jgi:hypothetical protein
MEKRRPQKINMELRNSGKPEGCDPSRITLALGECADQFLMLVMKDTRFFIHHFSLFIS